VFTFHPPKDEIVEVFWEAYTVRYRVRTSRTAAISGAQIINIQQQLLKRKNMLPPDDSTRRMIFKVFTIEWNVKGHFMGMYF